MSILNDNLMDNLGEIKKRLQQSLNLDEGIEMAGMNILGDCDCASGECDCDGSIWN